MFHPRRRPRIWNLHQSEPIASLEGHSAVVLSAVCFPTGGGGPVLGPDDPLVNSQFAIEHGPFIVDLPMRKGDFRWFCSFTRGYRSFCYLAHAVGSFLGTPNDGNVHSNDELCQLTLLSIHFESSSKSPGNPRRGTNHGLRLRFSIEHRQRT